MGWLFGGGKKNDVKPDYTDIQGNRVNERGDKAAKF